MRLSSSVSSAKRKPLRKEGTVLLTSDSSRRVRSGTAKDKTPAIEQANKAFIKRRVRAEIHGHKSQDHRTIYVGNLSPYITKEDIYQRFSSCGSIVDIQLRCSLGGLTSVSKPGENSYFPDLHYASIMFTQHTSGHNALRLNGSFLRGCRLTVSASATSMPEVEQSVEYQLTKLITGEEPLDHRARRCVQAQKTEIIPVNPPSDNNKLMGISFPKCIM